MTKIHKRGRYSAALKEKVSLEALKGEKTLQQIASENNISPELVRQWKKQAQEGVSQIFKRSKSREKALEEQNELLKSLLCKRKLELEWLTKKIQGAGSLVQRRQLLDEENSELPRKRQCELLSLHRSGTYYKPRAKADETPIEKALNELYIYRGYLQIACCDLTRSDHPSLWLLTWDPTQPISTRPLAIRKDGTWFAYGWDFTKNVCEVFGPAGYIRTNYTYSPYGVVNASGDVEQAIQWSSEFFDTELALVYYNYRHYNPMDGCWTTRDYIEERGGKNLYKIGSPIITTDILGAWGAGIKGQLGHISKRGHSDFEGNEPNGPFDYNLEDTDAETKPFNPKATWRHFRPLQESEKDLTLATKHCNKQDYERYAHQMQDFFAHYGQGFRANKYDYSLGDAIWALYFLMDEESINIPLKVASLIKLINYPYGHGPATIKGWLFRLPQPDNPEHYYDAYQQAAERSSMWYALWTKCCCYEKGNWIPIKDSTGKPLCADLEQPANPYGESAAPPAMPPTPSRHNYQPKSPTELKGFSIYI